MELLKALRLDPNEDRVISLVGSGGKTTLLYLLAALFARQGLAVGVTTTTHILRPAAGSVLTLVTSGLPHPRRGEITVCGTPAAEGKLTIPGMDTLEALLRGTDVCLVEADGSRRMPIKMPNETEPVLLAQTNRVIAVAGLSALGKPLGEVCHRAELVQQMLDVSLFDPVTPDLLARILCRGYGNIPHLTVLLNQADTLELKRQGGQIEALLGMAGISQTYVTSLKQEAKQGC